jgi:hypothetical protein
MLHEAGYVNEVVKGPRFARVDEVMVDVIVRLLYCLSFGFWYAASFQSCGFQG